MQIKLKTIISMAMFSLLIASCGKGNNSTSTSPSGEPSTTPSVSVTPSGTGVEEILSSDAKGEIWIMSWAGDNKEHLDIGSRQMSADELQGINVGMYYATAREFKKLYPNIKINLYSVSDAPDTDSVPWSQKIENFKLEKGFYPDVFSSFNIIDDMKKGLVADLSVYENTDVYKSYNPSLMSLMNYYGFQAGLPGYVIPWGVWVNRALARSKNITPPTVDWTWDDYTNFISKAESSCVVGELCGAYDASMMIPQGAFIEKQLQEYNSGSVYATFDTPEFIDAISKLPEQSRSSALGVHSGSTDPVSTTYLEKGGYYGYNYFKENLVLTFDGHPWFLYAANVEGDTNYVNSSDWDIYPRPAFVDAEGEVVIDNHVGINLDPLAIYNYANLDNNPELSANEKAKLDIAFAFASFTLTDTRAWQARANQQYVSIDPVTQGYVYNAAINDSFPVVVGDEFNAQMEIWYSTASHRDYADTNRFRGFAKVVKLWENGNIYGISDKAFPRYYHQEGDATDYEILEKISGFGNPDIVGVAINDPAWLSTYSALLRTFNVEINNRYALAFSELESALISYYGWSATEFVNN